MVIFHYKLQFSTINGHFQYQRVSFPPFSDHIRRGEQRPRGDKRNDRHLGGFWSFQTPQNTWLMMVDDHG